MKDAFEDRWILVLENEMIIGVSGASLDEIKMTLPFYLASLGVLSELCSIVKENELNSKIPKSLEITCM